MLVLYYLQRSVSDRSVGVVNLFEMWLIYWYGSFVIIFVILLFCIFLSQYLFWNPNKSSDLFSIYADFTLYTVKSVDFCGKFAIFNLKSIKISQFLNLFLNFSTILCHSRIQMVRGVSSQNYQFRSILNSKFVINYTNICNICSEILHILWISFNILSDFTPDIVKSMAF